MFMTIRSAAKAVGVSAQTLREYERVGLLRPERDSAGRRVFTPVDVAQARRVAADRAKRQGFKPARQGAQS